MLYFKEIILHPTVFKLHIVACNDDEQQSNFIKDNYSKIEHEQDIENLYGDFVIVLNYGEKKVIVCGLSNLNDRNGIVHELVHVKHRINDLAGVELNCAAQEWEAQFTEMVFREICKPNYEKIKKEK